MSNDQYQRAARGYLDRFIEEPTWDVYSPDAEDALVSLLATAHHYPRRHRATAISHEQRAREYLQRKGVDVWVRQELPDLVAFAESIAADCAAEVIEVVSRALAELEAHQCHTHDCGKTCGCSVNEARVLMRGIINSVALAPA